MKSGKVNFHYTGLQLVYSEWERREVPIRFAGKCCVCGANTFQTQGENGHWQDPDPRGLVGDRHSSASLEAKDYDMTGEDVPVCWSCRDTVGSYRKALDIAKRSWTAKQPVRPILLRKGWGYTDGGAK